MLEAGGPGGSAKTGPILSDLAWLPFENSPKQIRGVQCPLANLVPTVPRIIRTHWLRPETEAAND